MSNLDHPFAYYQALHRIEQLLTASSMTEDDEKRIEWRDQACAIADEWDVDYITRRRLMEDSHQNAIVGLNPQPWHPAPRVE